MKIRWNIFNELLIVCKYLPRFKFCFECKKSNLSQENASKRVRSYLKEAIDAKITSWIECLRRFKFEFKSIGKRNRNFNCVKSNKISLDDYIFLLYNW